MHFPTGPTEFGKACRASSQRLGAPVASPSIRRAAEAIKVIEFSIAEPPKGMTNLRFSKRPVGTSMVRRSTLVKHRFEPGNEVFEVVTEYKVHCCLKSLIKRFVVGNGMKGNRCFTCCPRTITCL